LPDDPEPLSPQGKPLPKAAPGQSGPVAQPRRVRPGPEQQRAGLWPARPHRTPDRTADARRL